MPDTVGTIYLQTIGKRFLYYKELGEKTFDQLTEDDFHFRPNIESNSITIIVLHMSGNMLSRWTNFLNEDGEKDWRMRDDEFEVHPFSRQQVIDIWNQGWNCFFTALQSITEMDLLKTIYIRQEPLFVIDAINRQLAHYPYHVGQILYLGKIIKDKHWKNLSMEKRKSGKVE